MENQAFRIDRKGDSKFLQQQVLNQVEAILTLANHHGLNMPEFINNFFYKINTLWTSMGSLI